MWTAVWLVSRGAALLSVVALLGLACTSRLPAANDVRVDEHGHDVRTDGAIAQTMADYRDAGGGPDSDRIPCGEYWDWDSLIAVSTGLGLDEADDVRGGGAAARRGELTRLTCTFGRVVFQVEGDGYVGEASTSAVHLQLLRGTPAPLRGLDPAITPGGRHVVAGEADLYDLGGWRHPDIDDTVAVAASTGETHTLLVAVRVQVSDVDGALLLLDGAWQDLGLPG